MERKIGEIFEFGGEWYQCVEGYHCYDCDFRHENGTCIIYANYPESKMGNCNGNYRTDNQNVVFKKLEKVGEPYIIGNKLIQRYKMYPTTYHINVYGWYYHNLDVKSWTIDIEIKQNKEDMEDLDKIKVRDYTKVEELNVMEEKKLNLKPFDIQKAREGKPVCTRDGRKARIICFDLKNDEYPIVAAVGNDSSETLFSYTTNGEIADGIESDKDLMMLPEKKEGWVNVYKNQIHDTPESAEEGHKGTTDYIKTIRVEWEE